MIRRKHAPAAGERQIHARISRSESGRHALPCVYPLRTHFAHASPHAYCCPYACNQRMCHIACVVAQVETQPNTISDIIIIYYNHHTERHSLMLFIVYWILHNISKWWSSYCISTQIITHDMDGTHTEWCTKWSSIWSINKIFISITILQTNVHKERPLHGDLSAILCKLAHVQEQRYTSALGKSKN
jgi:hypothetical protein